MKLAWVFRILTGALFAASFAIEGLCVGRIQSDLCDSAIASVAREYGVPKEVLLSIATVETGKNVNGRLESWPWSINLDGRGYWFENYESALRFASDISSSGVKDFDVGCFQINLRWHPDAFKSLDEALDPLVNATYAAQFLLHLKEEYDSWSDAISAYHSRQPEKGQVYLSKVQAVLETLRDESGNIDPTRSKSDFNGFPLLSGGVSNYGPSLVPVLLTGKPLYVKVP